jgi:hypothetical protein
VPLNRTCRVGTITGLMVRSREMQEGANTFVEQRAPHFRPGIER